MTDERIQEIVLRYGYDAQSRQCIEELAELTQAINKFWRKNLGCGCETLEEAGVDRESECYINLVEEIADVEIMLEQMKEMLHCGDKVAKIREEKLERADCTDKDAAGRKRGNDKQAGNRAAGKVQTLGRR